MNRNKFLIAAALLPAALPAWGQQKGKEKRQPNIIFIMADDLGYSDTGVTGSDYYETPNIDRLATCGMLFTQAYAAAANSAPSRACLLTGLYTPRHGVYTVSPAARGDKYKRKLIPIENREVLDTGFYTLAEALKDAGYTCGHVGKWHLGDDSEGTGPLSQGFSLNIAGCSAGTPYSYFYPYCDGNGRCMPGLEEGEKGEYLTDRLTTEAIRFMGSQKNHPFFLYMSHHAVHMPLKAPAALVEKYRAKVAGRHHNNPIYAAMIEKLDESVGRLCHALDSLRLTDNSIVIFFSDNGGHEGVTDNYPLRGGKGTPYEGGTRVPLIISWHGVVTPGSRSNVPVTGVDLYPTLVKCATGHTPKGVDGEDIFSLLAHPARTRALFWHFPAYLEAYLNNGIPFRATPYSTIRQGDYKLIHYYEDNSVELFNLKEDPGEKQNLAPVERGTARHLLKRLNRWIKATRAPIPTEPNPDYRATEP